MTKPKMLSFGHKNIQVERKFIFLIIFERKCLLLIFISFLQYISRIKITLKNIYY